MQFSVPEGSKNLLRDSYAFLSTRKIQNSRSTHHRLPSPKAHCSEEVTGKYVDYHLLCSIIGRIDQTILGRSNSFSIVELLSSSGRHIISFSFGWLLFFESISTTVTRSIVSSSNPNRFSWFYFAEHRLFKDDVLSKDYGKRPSIRWATSPRIKGCCRSQNQGKIALLAISSSIFIHFSRRDNISKGLGKTQLLQKVSFESDWRFESYEQ